MIKTLNYIIYTILASAILLSTATVYGKEVKLYVTNKCGPNQFLYITIKRDNIPCGYHRWDPWQTLNPTHTLTFGPRHIFQGCYFTVMWQRTKVPQKATIHKQSIFISKNDPDYKFEISGPVNCSIK